MINQRILIADDSPTVTGILSFIFGEQGWTIDAAADGVEALRRFYANPSDVVVLDIEMPRMNGYQVCRVLKDDPEMASVPVIILTSRDLQSDRFRGIAAGADAYIVKNLEDDQLLESVRQYLHDREINNIQRPKSKHLSESEILQTVNKILDRRLFISTVTAHVEDINARISDYTSTRRDILALFSTVFEFVTGGIAIMRGDILDTSITRLETFPEDVSLKFQKRLCSQASSFASDKEFTTGELELIQHSTVGSRQFPLSGEFVDEKFWPLKSGGALFGVIGIAGTSLLKFDLEGSELLLHFLRKAEIVLDNARLLKEMERANKELTETYDELKSTQTQLIQTEKMASLGQLMAGLAHEMNNPLNFVSGNIDYVERYSNQLLKIVEQARCKLLNDVEIVELLKETDYEFLRDDLPGMIADMKSGIDRSRNIISDLRTFASSDQLETVPVDLSLVITSTINLLKHQWIGEIEVISLFETNAPVDCHPGQIGQVVLNLLTNAISSIRETGRKDGKINIVLKINGAWIEFSVNDNGTGIKSTNIEKLFQPFYTTKDVGKGMGLGLSISYGIIKRHHGEIIVESILGQGSTFTVRLPMIELIVGS